MSSDFTRNRIVQVLFVLSLVAAFVLCIGLLNTWLWGDGALPAEQTGAPADGRPK